MKPLPGFYTAAARAEAKLLAIQAERTRDKGVLDQAHAEVERMRDVLRGLGGKAREVNCAWSHGAEYFKSVSLQLADAVIAAADALKGEET